MLERQREGIAKAKREGRYKGRVADRSASRLPRSSAQIGGRQALGNRQQAGDWTGQRLSGAG